MQAGVRLAALLGSGDIVVQAITRIGEFFAGRCDDTSLMPAGFSKISETPSRDTSTAWKNTAIPVPARSQRKSSK